MTEDHTRGSTKSRGSRHQRLLDELIDGHLGNSRLSRQLKRQDSFDDIHKSARRSRSRDSIDNPYVLKSYLGSDIKPSSGIRILPRKKHRAYLKGEHGIDNETYA